MKGFTTSGKGQMEQTKTNRKLGGKQKRQPNRRRKKSAKVETKAPAGPISPACLTVQNNEKLDQETKNRRSFDQASPKRAPSKARGEILVLKEKNAALAPKNVSARKTGVLMEGGA